MIGTFRLGLVASAAALCAFAVATPSHASLIAPDGITYTLTESTTGNPLVDQFTLDITGINGPSDTSGGRSGVQSFAFGTPANFLSATAPSGFTTMTGGLNSMGCDGSGAFFCFKANTTPGTTPALAANSSLSYTFDVTVSALSSGKFPDFGASFKINWVGSKNNYDLVSEDITPTPGTPVPEPSTLALVGTALLGIGLLAQRRRNGV